MHDAPGSTLLDLEGNVISLASYHDKLVLLVFMRWLG